MASSSAATWAELFTEIAIIDQLASTAAQRLLPPDLSLAGYGVLNHLERLPGDWGPARLAKAFQLTKGAMTNTVQRLEASGYVSLEDDPSDRRSRFVRLTPAGIATLAKSREALAPRLAHIADVLDADDVGLALPVLRRLRSWLDENR